MKTVTALTAAVIAAGLYAAPAAAQTLKKVADNNVVTVAHREASVTFSYLVDGQPVGFAVDLTAGTTYEFSGSYSGSISYSVYLSLRDAFGSYIGGTSSSGTTGFTPTSSARASTASMCSCLSRASMTGACSAISSAMPCRTRFL